MKERAERFARMIHEALTGILPDLVDPRVADVDITITQVRVSGDLGSAHVLIAVDTTDEKRRARLLQGLEAAGPYLRRQLAEALDAKKTPQVRFSIDDTDSRADRVEELLLEIAQEAKSPSPSAPKPEPEK
jgi:ribosome-binding factor A